MWGEESTAPLSLQCRGACEVPGRSECRRARRRQSLPSHRTLEHARSPSLPNGGTPVLARSRSYRPPRRGRRRVSSTRDRQTSPRPPPRYHLQPSTRNLRCGHLQQRREFGPVAQLDRRTQGRLGSIAGSLDRPDLRGTPADRHLSRRPCRSAPRFGSASPRRTQSALVWRCLPDGPCGPRCEPGHGNQTSAWSRAPASPAAPSNAPSSLRSRPTARS